MVTCKPLSYTTHLCIVHGVSVCACQLEHSPSPSHMFAIAYTPSIAIADRQSVHSLFLILLTTTHNASDGQVSLAHLSPSHIIVTRALSGVPKPEVELSALQCNTFQVHLTLILLFWHTLHSHHIQEKKRKKQKGKKEEKKSYVDGLERLRQVLMQQGYLVIVTVLAWIH